MKLKALAGLVAAALISSTGFALDIDTSKAIGSWKVDNFTEASAPGSTGEGMFRFTGEIGELAAAGNDPRSGEMLVHLTNYMKFSEGKILFKKGDSGMIVGPFDILAATGDTLVLKADDKVYKLSRITDEEFEAKILAWTMDTSRPAMIIDETKW